MKEKKPTIMVSFVEGGENGGPFVSHKRIIDSELSLKYKFIPLIMPKGRLGLFNLKVIIKLTRDILSVKPDIVHIAGLQLSGFHFAIACKLAGVKKVIIAVHGSSSEALQFSRIKKYILNILEGITLRIVQNSYGVSEYVANWSIIKKNSKRSFGCIYNLPPSDDRHNINNKSIREELNIDNDEIVIISTGRITQEKGFHILKDVIKKIDTKRKIRFVIVGDGKYLETMRSELIKEIDDKKVFLLGYRSDIDRILAGSDIFVICTLHETLCISLIEAAKNGLALVATNVGGIPEIIKDSYNGFLTEINDINSVMVALNLLIEDDKKRKEFGSNAKKVIDEKFSRECILEKIDNMYRSIINE